MISLTGSRVYDGSTAVSNTVLTNSITSQLVSGESLNLTGAGSVNTKHVGSAKSLALGSLSLSDATVGASTYLASNYTLTGGAHTADVTQASVTFSTSDVVKTYDGSTSAVGNTIVASGGNGSGGLFAADSFSGGAFAYTSADVGISAGVVQSNRVVTVQGVSIDDGNNGANYNINYANNTSSRINQKQLTLSASRAYDATTDLTGVVSIGGLVNGQTLTYTGATASDKHVATADKYISSISLVSGTGNASNYLLPSLGQYAVGVNSVTITPRILSASITNTGVSKVYDGSSSGPAGLTPTFNLTGYATGDSSASLSYASSSFNSANVNAASSLTLSGLSIGSLTSSVGSQTSDYALSSGSASVAATVSRKNLTAVYTAANKVYDGGSSANVTGSSADIVTGDVVNFTQSASFANGLVGAAKVVSISGISLGGLSAGNYNLVNQSTNASADITPKALSLQGLTANNRVENGSSVATILSYGNLQGLVTNDRVSLNTLAAMALFNSSSAGLNKPVTVTGLLLAGLDAGNYLFVGPWTTYADISTGLTSRASVQNLIASSTIQGPQHNQPNSSSRATGNQGLLPTMGSNNQVAGSMVSGITQTAAPQINLGGINPVAARSNVNQGLGVSGGLGASGSSPVAATSVATTSSVPGVASASGSSSVVSTGYSSGNAVSSGSSSAPNASTSASSTTSGVVSTNVLSSGINTSGFVSVKTPQPVSVSSGEVAKVQLAPETFIHSASDEKLRLEARSADGTPLPSWVKFDSNTGTFDVTPPAGQAGKLPVSVTAYDTKGNAVSTELMINLDS